MLLKCTEDAAAISPRITFPHFSAICSGDFPCRSIVAQCCAFFPFPLLLLIFAALSAPRRAATPEPCAAPSPIPSGAVIPNATVHLTNAVSGFDRTTSTDSTRPVQLSQRPVQPLPDRRLRQRLCPLSQNVEIRSSVGVNLKLVLQIAGGSQTVIVEAAGDLIEDDPTFHVDVDRDLFNKVPLESHPPRSARWSRSPPPASPPTPTASFTASATTPPTPSPLTASPSPTSRARSSPTSFPPTPFNPLKSSAARPRPSTAAKPASSSWLPPAPARALPSLRASITLPTDPSDRRPAALIFPTAEKVGATSSRPTASTPDAFSIRLSSPSSTTRATSRTSSTASTIALRRPIPSTWT